MKKRSFKIMVSPQCDFCTNEASVRGVEKYGDKQKNACGICMSLNRIIAEAKPIEIFICGHLKKCGWQGQQHELEYRMNPVRPGPKTCLASTGHCPQCGSSVFFIRPLNELNPE